MAKRKAAVSTEECVACGRCVKECPASVITLEVLEV
ncbi:MAG: 4Fe-4S binding protein [Hungatella sp.]|nr:4Fe-4S binding protein [Hungatella sp.]